MSNDQVYPQRKSFTFSNPQDTTEEEQNIELRHLPVPGQSENAAYTEILKSCLTPEATFFPPNHVHQNFTCIVILTTQEVPTSSKHMNKCLQKLVRTVIQRIEVEDFGC